MRQILFNPDTGERRPTPLNEETVTNTHGVDDCDAWVNIPDPPTVLRTFAKRGVGEWDPGDAVIVSERDGYRHLYLVRRVGKSSDSGDSQKKKPPRVTRLTKGDWCVHRVHGVDEEKGHVYFTANEQSPLEQHLYRCCLSPKETDDDRVDGSDDERKDETSLPSSGTAGVCTTSHAFALERLTLKPGVHTIALNYSFTRIVDVFDDTQTPPGASLVPILKETTLDCNQTTSGFSKKLSDSTRSPVAVAAAAAALLIAERAEVLLCKNGTDQLCATTASYAQTDAQYVAPTLFTVRISQPNPTTVCRYKTDTFFFIISVSRRRRRHEAARRGVFARRGEKRPASLPTHRGCVRRAEHADRAEHVGPHR